MPKQDEELKELLLSYFNEIKQKNDGAPAFGGGIKAEDFIGFLNVLSKTSVRTGTEAEVLTVYNTICNSGNKAAGLQDLANQFTAAYAEHVSSFTSGLQEQETRKRTKSSAPERQISSSSSSAYQGQQQMHGLFQPLTPQMFASLPQLPQQGMIPPGLPLQSLQQQSQSFSVGLAPTPLMNRAPSPSKSHEDAAIAGLNKLREMQ